MKEGKARETIARAEKAASLLRNDILAEAFESLEADFI